MAIIFYASENKISPEQVPLLVKGWRKQGSAKPGPDRTVWVRAELMEDEWPGAAMDKAKPKKGEVALNAVPNKVVIVPKVK